MAFFNEFPHTRTYDSDLGWLIEYVKNKLIEDEAWKENTLKDFMEIINKWATDGTLQELVGKNLTSSYYNVKFYGAKGDGIADDTEAILNCIADAEGGTVYFPQGTYLISKTLEFSLEKRTSLLLDNAIIRQTTQLQPMIKYGVSSGPNYPRGISGNGVLDMDNLGGVGLNVTNSAGYSVFENLQVRNCSNGIGVYVGDINGETAASLQVSFKDVKIYGTDSRLPGTGLYIDAFDCSFDNLYLYLCQTGCKMLHGGHSFGFVHVWTHTYTAFTDDEFKKTVGFDIDGSLFCNFLYLDSVYKGVKTNSNTVYCDKFYYTSDITQVFTGDIEAILFDCDRYSKIVLNKALLYNPHVYTVKCFNIEGQNSVFGITNQRKIYVDHQIDENSKYNIFDEAFNSSILPISKRICPSSVYESNRYYLLGYIKNVAGILTLHVNLKYQLNFNATMWLDNGTLEIVDSNLIHPGSVSDRHLYYGTEEEHFGVNWTPLYIKFDNRSSSVLIEIFSEIYGEGGFYPILRTDIANVPYISDSAGLTEIPLTTTAQTNMVAEINAFSVREEPEEKYNIEQEHYGIREV